MTKWKIEFSGTIEVNGKTEEEAKKEAMINILYGLDDCIGINEENKVEITNICKK